MSNPDLFAPLDAETLDFDIFAIDESVVQNGETTADFAFLEGFDHADNLESFDDLFNTFALADQGEELVAVGLNGKNSDRISLLPPFLREYESLKQNSQQLQLALTQAEQALVAQERRSRSNDSLIEEQATEISKNQEYLTQTVAEIQVYRDEAKRQQLQVETLAEQLAIGQNRIAELERDCVKLQQNSQNSGQVESMAEQLAIAQNRIAELERTCVRLQENSQNSGQNVHRLEQQVLELRTRLQRQQRYALQYKTALEQCLSLPNVNPSSDITSAIASLTGKSPQIQPWSSHSAEEGLTPIKSILENPEHLGLNLNETVALATESPVMVSEITAPIPLETLSSTSELPKMVELENIFPWEGIKVDPANLESDRAAIAETTETVESAEKVSTPEPSLLRRQRASHLSFSIQSQRAPRKAIDLPSFARQTVPQT
ncbi:MAG: hypothetical protein ACRC6M_03645 [Microcystaceae cyanobacterium]